MNANQKVSNLLNGLSLEEIKNKIKGLQKADKILDECIKRDLIEKRDEKYYKIQKTS
tara:strand:+ start:1784 stop:1954 length:171 start_codon:yes stop_codon:yes gene_type:complete